MQVLDGYRQHLPQLFVGFGLYMGFVEHRRNVEYQQMCLFTAVMRHLRGRQVIWV